MPQEVTATSDGDGSAGHCPSYSELHGFYFMDILLVLLFPAPGLVQSQGTGMSPLTSCSVSVWAQDRPDLT